MEKSSRTFNQLRLLSFELNSILLQMEDTDLPEETYVPILEKLKSTIQPNFLFTRWDQTKNQITNESLNILQICASLNGSDERIIPEQDIKNIFVDINAIETLFKNKTYSTQLTSFVIEQIKNIKNSILEYKIIGAKAFEKPFFEAQASVIQNVEIFKENDADTKTLLSKLGNVWKNISIYCSKAGKPLQTISSGFKLLEESKKVVNDVVDFFK